MACASCILAGEMLLRHWFRGHWLERCCCDICFVHMRLRNVAVALVWWTSAVETLLWHVFREHLLEKCGCGSGFVDIGLRDVAAALFSWTLA